MRCDPPHGCSVFSYSCSSSFSFCSALVLVVMLIGIFHLRFHGNISPSGRSAQLAVVPQLRGSRKLFWDRLQPLLPRATPTAAAGHTAVSPATSFGRGFHRGVCPHVWDADIAATSDPGWRCDVVAHLQREGNLRSPRLDASLFLFFSFSLVELALRAPPACEASPVQFSSFGELCVRPDPVISPFKRPPPHTHCRLPGCALARRKGTLRVLRQLRLPLWRCMWQCLPRVPWCVTWFV